MNKDEFRTKYTAQVEGEIRTLESEKREIQGRYERDIKALDAKLEEKQLLLESVKRVK